MREPALPTLKLREDVSSAPSAAFGRGGVTRIGAALVNTIRGLREGVATEAAIKQEVAMTVVAVPISLFVAQSVWIWVALIASLLLVLLVEFFNTAVERLCDHMHPDRHDAIRVVKDLASASVFFALALAALVWLAAIWVRLM